MLHSLDQLEVRVALRSTQDPTAPRAELSDGLARYARAQPVRLELPLAAGELRFAQPRAPSLGGVARSHAAAAKLTDLGNHSRSRRGVVRFARRVVAS
eukprot:scaffold54024_cov72-Phaeocystis_antarctica.AAC.4